MTTEFCEFTPPESGVLRAGQETSSAPAAITRHPSASVFDAVFALALPAVGPLAECKNVTLAPENHESVLRHALHNIAREKLAAALNGNYDPVLCAIDRSLDVVGAMNWMNMLLTLRGAPSYDPLVLIADAEAAVDRDRRDQGGANDRDPRIFVWPDLATLAKTSGSSAPFQFPRIRLPEGASVIASLGEEVSV